MKKYIYGIDFGTTNSALAILDVEKNEVVQLFTTPSLLFFPKMQDPRAPVAYFVGKKAVEQYVASRMSGRFMKSIKRILPNRSFRHTKIAAQLFKAEDLVSLILSFLKKQADEFLNQNVTTAVIGRPVVFDENPEKDSLAQERLSKAAKNAGFEEFYFQMEPIGAAFTYEQQITKKELVLVADCGGGTSDFSLLYLNPASKSKVDRQNDMLAKGGIYIGGDNFDSDIMWHRGTPHFGYGVKEKFGYDKWLDLPLTYFKNICSWERMNFLDSRKMINEIERSYIFSGRNEKVKNLLTLIQNNLGYVLFKQIEQAKIELSKQDETAFSFEQDGISFKEKITLHDFKQEIIRKNLDKIDGYLQAFLKKQNIKSTDIDTVFMTGGTSMVRPLRNRFIQQFGTAAVKSGDNFNSVAIGLARSYSSFL